MKDRAPEFTPTREDQFDGMNLEQLREFIATNTGQAAAWQHEPQDPGADGA